MTARNKYRAGYADGRSGNPQQANNPGAVPSKWYREGYAQGAKDREVAQ